MLDMLILYFFLIEYAVNILNQYSVNSYVID